MANFQNVGTTNAGIFTLGGSAMGGAPSGVPMMDAAAIQSGGAFLTSELEKRDPLIRKPLTSVTYPRDIPVKVGGGWVDYVSAMSVAYGIANGSGDSAVTGGGANGVPLVQASVSKGAFKAHVFATALRVMFQDMQRANGIGRSLDQLLQEGIRLTYDKHIHTIPSRILVMVEHLVLHTQKTVLDMKVIHGSPDGMETNFGLYIKANLLLRGIPMMTGITPKAR